MKETCPCSSNTLVSFIEYEQVFKWHRYGMYSQRVRTMNTSIKMLEHTWQEWHGLTFHEKRQPVNVDRMVRQTEAAIMKPYEDFFQPSRGAAKPSEARHSAGRDSDSGSHSNHDARQRHV